MVCKILRSTMQIYSVPRRRSWLLEGSTDREVIEGGRIRPVDLRFQKPQPKPLFRHRLSGSPYEGFRTVFPNCASYYSIRLADLEIVLWTFKWSRWPLWCVALRSYEGGIGTGALFLFCEVFLQSESTGNSKTLHWKTKMLCSFYWKSGSPGLPSFKGWISGDLTIT